MTFYSIIFTVFALSTSAYASGGCYDGDWVHVKTATTETTLDNYAWNVSFHLDRGGKTGRFVMQTNYPKPSYFNTNMYFVEAPYKPSSSFIIETLTGALKRGEKLKVKVVVETWENRVEDECFGYPVGTRMENTTQTFDVVLSGGSAVTFNSNPHHKYFNDKGEPIESH